MLGHLSISGFLIPAIIVAYLRHGILADGDRTYYIVLYAAIFLAYNILIRGTLWYFRVDTHKNATLKKIDAMSGTEFEEYLGHAFRKKGYRVEFTPKSYDYGADLIIEKHRIRTAVQVKRYSHNVGNAAIQEVLGARGYYKTNQCMVVTNSYFTKSAVRLANVNNVELWDRDRLADAIKKHK